MPLAKTDVLWSSITYLAAALTWGSPFRQRYLYEGRLPQRYFSIRTDRAGTPPCTRQYGSDTFSSEATRSVAISLPITECGDGLLSGRWCDGLGPAEQQATRECVLHGGGQTADGSLLAHSATFSADIFQISGVCARVQR